MKVTDCGIDMIYEWVKVSAKIYTTTDPIEELIFYFCNFFGMTLYLI